MTFDLAAYLVRSIDALLGLHDNATLDLIEQAANLMTTALHDGHKIMFCGNGGSAGDAQHLAAELVGSFYDRGRPALAGLALTTDTSALTAIGNDLGFERVFSRQVSALGCPGDVLVALSTSGNSENILKVIAQAHFSNIKIIALTGAQGGQTALMVYPLDILIRAPSDETPIVQQCHMALGHAMIAAVEAAMFPKKEG